MCEEKRLYLLYCLRISLLQVRESRDPQAAKQCLAAIEECARTRDGNLLALAVDAARARSVLRSINQIFID